jgi:hypothetical protein
MEHGMDIAGSFETHITIEAHSQSSITTLQEWCAARGLKCLLIVLDRGATTSQPMLTRRSYGTFVETLAAAKDLTAGLASAGFVVARIKLEVDVDSPGVPVTAPAVEGGYFETHIKLLLSDDADLQSLRDAVQPHSAHLSRNALRPPGSGTHERFVTQRCLNAGRDDAKLRLGKLLDAIGYFGHPVIELEEEFVVFDSNATIDAGWIL